MWKRRDRANYTGSNVWCSKTWRRKKAQTLMQIPAVRQPGVPLAPVTFRGREYVRHEDNRALIVEQSLGHYRCLRPGNASH